VKTKQAPSPFLQEGMHAWYRSLNAIAAQSKNCPFGDNTIKLKNVTTSENNGI
jgi:hypothetical protein